MEFRWIGICLLMGAVGCGCSSDSAAEAASSGDAAQESSVSQDATAEDAPECDPRPWKDHDASDDEPPMSEGGVISIDAGGDLEGGKPPPMGRTACGMPIEFDAAPYDPCPNYGKECCLLKNECYDPPNEPEFCLRPYCE